MSVKTSTKRAKSDPVDLLEETDTGKKSKVDTADNNESTDIEKEEKIVLRQFLAGLSCQSPTKDKVLKITVLLLEDCVIAILWKNAYSYKDQITCSGPKDLEARYVRPDSIQSVINFFRYSWDSPMLPIEKEGCYLQNAMRSDEALTRERMEALSSFWKTFESTLETTNHEKSIRDATEKEVKELLGLARYMRLP